MMFHHTVHQKDKFFIPALCNGSFQARRMLFSWKLHLYSLDAAHCCSNATDIMKPAKLYVSDRGIQLLLFLPIWHGTFIFSLRGVFTVSSI